MFRCLNLNLFMETRESVCDSFVFIFIVVIISCSIEVRGLESCSYMCIGVLVRSRVVI